MNNGDFVSFEVSKLLNVKGYNKERVTYYTDNGNIIILPDDNKSLYPAPTLYEVQKWLIEDKKIAIYSYPMKYDDGVYWQYAIHDMNTWNTYCTGKYHSFKTYEESINEGIKESLKYI